QTQTQTPTQTQTQTQTRTRTQPQAQTPTEQPALPIRARVQAVNFVDEPSRSSVIIDLAGTPAGEVRVDRQDAHTLVLTVPGAQLSDNAPRTLDTAEYMGPVLRVQMKQASGAVRLQVDLADHV